MSTHKVLWPPAIRRSGDYEAICWNVLYVVGGVPDDKETHIYWLLRLAAFRADEGIAREALS